MTHAEIESALKEVEFQEFNYFRGETVDVKKLFAAVKVLSVEASDGETKEELREKIGDLEHELADWEDRDDEVERLEDEISKLESKIDELEDELDKIRWDLDAPPAGGKCD